MPEQCPECGRFLKNDLVMSLTEGDAACPRCGRDLTAAMFGLATADHLEGWDEGDGDEATATRRGSPLGGIALEPDEALLAGIGGGILGALVLREHPGVGALLGAFAGMVAGGLLRQAQAGR